jgi:hypothetical protein
MAEDRVAGRKEGRAADAGYIGQQPYAADAARDRPGARWMIGFGAQSRFASIVAAKRL